MKYSAAVITVSDSCYSKQKEDLSGPALTRALESIGISVAYSEVVPDERSTIISVLQKCIAMDGVHVILTTGGTGFAPRDVTPEATRAVLERSAPGLAELLRQAGASQTPLTWLSRAEAGIAGSKLIVNLPGSTKAMAHSIQTLRTVLFHALDLLNGAKPH